MRTPLLRWAGLAVLLSMLLVSLAPSASAHPVRFGWQCESDFWGGSPVTFPQGYYPVDVDWTEAYVNKVASDPTDPNNWVSTAVHVNYPFCPQEDFVVNPMFEQLEEALGVCFDDPNTPADDDACAGHGTVITLCYETCLPVERALDRLPGDSPLWT